MLKIDLHVHTGYSEDCLMSIYQLLKVVENSCINGLAVTDHNEIAGALALKDKAKLLQVIVGEEIDTKRGEIIGLFLKEKIPPGLSAAETVDRIKNQNGLVYIPHPFDRLRSSAIDLDALKEIISEVDIIETFNARNIFARDNKKAATFVNSYNLISAAGSDAHTCREVGNSYLKMKNFTSQQDFLKNIKDAQLVMQHSGVLVHGYTKIIKLFGGLFNGRKSDKEVS